MRKRDNKEIKRKQILRKRKRSRNDLLEKEKHQISEEKLTRSFNPAYQNIRSIMEELHILLISNTNKEHKKVLSCV